MPDKASLNFDQLISAASARHGVPEHLVRGVIQQESGGDPLAVSKKGARGLMQLLPSTAADMGVQDEFDPAQNIDGGTKYLGQLLKRYGGDQNKALAAYNFGMGNVERGAAWPVETKEDVAKVSQLAQEASGRDVYLSNRQDPNKKVPPEDQTNYRAQPVEGNSTANLPVTYVPKEPPVAQDPGDRQAQLMQRMEQFVRDGKANERQVALFNRARQLKGLEPVLPQNQKETPAEVQQITTPGLREAGLVATGFNHGIGSVVDLFNDGLQGLGLPMSDEPFMGTAWIDKHLEGAQFRPASLWESMLQRSGFEVGANVPLLGAALKARGAAEATQVALEIGTPAARDVMFRKSVHDAGASAGSLYQAMKNVPHEIVTQMTEISPSKLAAIETALAAGAGAGADLVSKVFPEGGRLAEFAGEVIGSFAPSVVIGMIRKARQAVHTGARVILGAETEEETRRRLGKTLEPAAKPEDVEAGVQRAAELRQEISPGAAKDEGLRLSAGEAIPQGSVSDTQLAFEKSSPAARSKARDRRTQNIQAVYDYFNKTEPAGNTTALVESLETQRRALLESGQADVARTQARIDAMRGDISKRGAALLEDLERRMQKADATIDARLRALNPMLSNKQRGEVIRGAYLEEVGKFRERAAADYRELDQLGHAELPVTSTIQKLGDIQAQFPEQMQVIAKMNPRVAAVLQRMGHDYELMMRAEKAMADLEIRDASGAGFRTLDDLGRPEGGLKRGTPQWYKDLTLKMTVKSKDHLDPRTGKPMDEATRASSSRDQIDAALKDLAAGKQPSSEVAKEVADRIRADQEFLKTPYYEPVMEELLNTPSASLQDLRQVRSDLLTMARNARAGDNRVQSYVLHELTGAIDGDIDALLPGTSKFAEFYPDHGTLYRNISADYRAGVETLYKGTANKLRRVNRYGDYTQDDESVPGLFWKNETSIDDFLKAFENQDMAKIALRDYAMKDWTEKAIQRLPDGRLSMDPNASAEWLRQNQDKLKAFPDLQAHFTDVAALQERADALREQVAAYQQGKRGQELLMRRVEAERRPGDFTPRDITEAEAELKHFQDVAERNLHDWQANKASLFLKQNAQDVGYLIATGREPVKEYEKALAMVKHDPDAVAGLNKAIWEGLVEKMQPKLTGLTGEMNLGVFHKELQKWIEGNGQIMERVLGPEGMARLRTTAEAVQKISKGGRDRSDTAINLQVQAALASTLVSRTWATLTGRVPMLYGGGERAANFLIKTFARMTAKQQEAILLEAFFDPKVYQTLVNAGTYGPDNALVKHQLRLHLYNLSELHEDNQ